jgi:hypothetical protein
MPPKNGLNAIASCITSVFFPTTDLDESIICAKNKNLFLEAVYSKVDILILDKMLKDKYRSYVFKLNDLGF